LPYRRTRRRKGCKPIPAHLPRIEVEYDIPEEEKQCPCGCTKTRIGEESSKEIEIIPQRVIIHKHIRYKYACKSCQGVANEFEGKVATIAPVSEKLLPGTMSTPGLLAYLTIGKFCDALPFYRQEKQFARTGPDLPRSTMCNRAAKAAGKIDPILRLLNKELLSGPLIGLDETILQVMKEPGRENTTRS